VSAEPPDLTYFLLALEEAAAREDFSHDDVSRVEWGWQLPDSVVATFGWVLALKDGRRFYLEMDVTDLVESPPRELEIELLAAGQEFPVFEEGDEVAWYRPDHINKHLGVSPPPLN
jgi:hypothetical protein